MIGLKRNYFHYLGPWKVYETTNDGFKRTVTLELQVDTNQFWVGARQEIRSGWSGFRRTVYVNLLPCLALRLVDDRPSKSTKVAYV